MTFRIYCILFFVALIPPIVISRFQPVPGYMDADYYYAGGIQLVEGRGFTEPYMWNYLDGSTSLPHPSHSYWQPLASIVAALGMWIVGQVTYEAARIPFILITGLIPPVTAYLAFLFIGKRELAITSGALAVFSVFFAPFSGVTDNFGPFMLIGGLYWILVSLLIASPQSRRNWFLLGLSSGLLTLARSDGLVWLGVAVLFIFGCLEKPSVSYISKTFIRRLLFLVIGFLIVMLPWYARNFSIYDSIMAPGGSLILWLHNYDQMFSSPSSQLNLQSFLAAGWPVLLSQRFHALWLNIQSAIAVQGEIILFPFILGGLYAYRSELRIKLVVIAWLILFIAMTFIFPFAGTRGAFFHAGAAFQPLWWALAPIGLDEFLTWLRKKNWGDDQTPVLFRGALILLAAVLTIFVVYFRVLNPGWGIEYNAYSKMDSVFVENGFQPDDIVIVGNPPGYYIETQRFALPIPYGGEQTLLEISDQFNARYLVLDSKSVLDPLDDLYQNPPDDSAFIFLGQIDDAKLYKIETR